jgi:hypothetical protein
MIDDGPPRPAIFDNPTDPTRSDVPATRSPNEPGARRAP